MRSATAQSRRPARGFTFVELVVGLMVTTLVLGALASFALAVSARWEHAAPGPVSMGAPEGTGVTVQSLLLARRLATTRLQRELRGMRQTGLVRAGSLDGSAALAAAAMLRSSAADPAQLRSNEVALLEHDPVTRTIRLYQLKPDLAVINLYNSTLFSSTTPEDMKAYSSLLAVKVLAHDVVGARFKVIGGGGGTSPRPMLEYALKFERGRQSALEYGSVTLRAPLPNAQ